MEVLNIAEIRLIKYNQSNNGHGRNNSGENLKNINP